MTAQTKSTRRPLGRSRWAAVGAATAVTLGAGGMLQAGAVANDSSSPALFVATTPCRLLDTRDTPETVGPRATPLGANDTFTTIVIGTTACALPTDATTLVMNVTATDQTASSFLTVYGDGTRPLTSSLNWDITSGDTANAVTANVSANGELSFYNLAGTTNIVADVVGYYTSTAFEDYFTKAEVAAMIADNPGAVGPVGDTGADGQDGATGSDGLTGPQGNDGPTGPMSTVPGPAGTDGQAGATGPMGPQGPAGLNGIDGINGLDGATGPMGPQGPAGNDGLDGATGPMGPQGPAGNDGLDGATGPMGPQGPQGTAGATGAIGSGVAALFYAMMPGDNSAAVPVGGAIDFPNSGPNTDALSIFRMGVDPDEFILARAGVYRVSVQVSVDRGRPGSSSNINGTDNLLDDGRARNRHRPDHDGHAHHRRSG